VKALFAQCGGLVLPPLNNMEIPIHILNGQIEDVAMETLNLSMEEVFALMLQMERVQCRAPKFLVDPLEGPSMRQCGSGWNLGHDPNFQH